MDLDKLLKVAVDYAADWSRVTLLTLRHPVSHFALVDVPSRPVAVVEGTTLPPRERWLDPKLFAYAALSIVIGSLITSILPRAIKPPEMVVSVVVLLLYWLTYGSLLYCLCRILGGRAGYLATISVSLQVLAATYVAACFLSLLATAAALTFFPSLLHVPFFGPLFQSDPVMPFFLVGIVVLLVYVPLATKSLHRFGRWQTGMLVPLPILMWAIAIAVYSKTGVLPIGGRVAMTPIPSIEATAESWPRYDTPSLLPSRGQHSAARHAEHWSS